MTITRLSGGTTPPNGSDPRTFPAIWNDAVDDIEAAEADITTLQGDVSALQDDLFPSDITNPVAGQKLVYNGNNWINFVGYVFVQTLYFTSNGTFTKSDYPFLQAIRVKVQGGGAGGAGSGVFGTNKGGAGGSGGGYGESFITNIADLDANVVITRGAGGGASASNVNFSPGNNGGNSSFGSLVIGNGGIGATDRTATRSTAGGTATGDLQIPGGSSTGSSDVTRVPAGRGGSSVLGQGGSGAEDYSFNNNGTVASGFGGGGGGGFSGSGGSAGTAGIVIIELFA